MVLAAGTISVPVAYTAILPELILIGGALVLLTASSLTRRRLANWMSAWFTAGIGLASVGASVWLWLHVEDRGSYTAIKGAIAVDGFSVLFLMLLGSALVLASLAGDAFLTRERFEATEFHVLAMLSVSGAMFMAAGNDLIVIFLGLEIMSIALYVLAGLNSRRVESGEAAMKYFILGAFSSALFLYGIALTYGATGTTNLPQIARYLSTNVITSNGVLLAGLALLLVGFGFKVAAVPFHTWTPDVYQGSPTPVTGLMASVAKAGGFAGLLRVFFSSFSSLRLDWQPIVWVLAVLTLVLGATLAVVQRDTKRMLAYSSINHAGFVLVGLQAATMTGISGSLYYLFAYTFLVMGSFTVVTLVGRKGDAAHDLGVYRGLARRHPWLAGAFTLFLLGQAGIPFTTGFLAKFYVIAAVVQSRSYALAVIAMVSAVVAAFFYLRLVFYMYSSPEDVPFAAADPRGGLDAVPVATGAHVEVVGSSVGRASGAGLSGGGAPGVAPGGARGGEAAVVDHPGSPASPTEAIRVPPGAALGIGLCAVFTVLFGLWPGPVIDLAHKATLLF